MTAIFNSYFYTPHERTYHNMGKKTGQSLFLKACLTLLTACIYYRKLLYVFKVMDFYFFHP